MYIISKFLRLVDNTKENDDDDDDDDTIHCYRCNWVLNFLINHKNNNNNKNKN